jgi:hypothetical protein
MESKTYRIVTSIALAVLVLGLVGGVFYFEKQIGEDKGVIENLNIQVTSINATHAVENATHIIELNNAQATMIVIHSTATQYAQQKQAQLGTLQDELDQAKDKLIEAEKIALCEDKPEKINYSSNQAVSNSLKTWLEEKGKIDKVTWDAVWSNSKTTIHKLTGKHLYVYIVYFNEPDLHYTNSVYSVQNSCFLDY